MMAHREKMNPHSASEKSQPLRENSPCTCKEARPSPRTFQFVICTLQALDQICLPSPPSSAGSKHGFSDHGKPCRDDTGSPSPAKRRKYLWVWELVSRSPYLTWKALLDNRQLECWHSQELRITKSKGRKTNA